MTRSHLILVTAIASSLLAASARAEHAPAVPESTKAAARTPFQVSTTQNAPAALAFPIPVGQRLILSNVSFGAIGSERPYLALQCNFGGAPMEQFLFVSGETIIGGETSWTLSQPVTLLCDGGTQLVARVAFDTGTIIQYTVTLTGTLAN